MSITVLLLGATRGSQSNWGLPGAIAPTFYLRDVNNVPAYLADESVNATVLIFSGHSDQINSKTDVINDLLHVYNSEKDVQILGITSLNTLSILGPGETRSSILQEKCPGLRLVIDNEGNVLRDYRVNGNPVMVIIDKNHVIRGRVMINLDGAELSASEIIQSLRPLNPMVSNNPTGLQP